MQWADFLDKIQDAKKKKIKLGFNANVMTRLIFSGAFNYMIVDDPEYTKMYGYARCLRMTEEALAVMKSKAQLPKATKTEPVGIEDINSDASLILWRHIVNPLFSYNLSSLYKNWLYENFGFVPNTIGNVEACPMTLTLPDKPSCDLYSSWNHVFEASESLEGYKKGHRLASIMGVVVKAAPRWYGDGKKCFDFTVFDGFHEYEFVMWPPRGQYEYRVDKAVDLKPCKFGLFVLKPSVWKGRKGGSLIKFYPMIT